MGLLIDECNTVSEVEPLDATLFTAACFLSNLPIPILAYALWGFKTNDFHPSLATLAITFLGSLLSLTINVGAIGIPFFL